MGGRILIQNVLRAEGVALHVCPKTPVRLKFLYFLLLTQKLRHFYLDDVRFFEILVEN